MKRFISTLVVIASLFVAASASAEEKKVPAVNVQVQNAMLAAYAEALKPAAQQVALMREAVEKAEAAQKANDRDTMIAELQKACGASRQAVTFYAEAGHYSKVISAVVAKNAKSIHPIVRESYNQFVKNMKVFNESYDSLATRVLALAS
jgi:hypothetical protein